MCAAVGSPAPVAKIDLVVKHREGFVETTTRLVNPGVSDEAGS
jgi:hypothetical protein